MCPSACLAVIRLVGTSAADLLEVVPCRYGFFESFSCKAVRYTVDVDARAFCCCAIGSRSYGRMMCAALADVSVAISRRELQDYARSRKRLYVSLAHPAGDSNSLLNHFSRSNASLQPDVRH
nr:hypothetical protein CFP56_69448 [Quercus suber]